MEPAKYEKNFKSAFALNCAKFNAINKKVPVLYLDTELDKNEEQIPRLLGMSTGVEYSDIETGNFASNEFKQKSVLDAARIIEDKEKCPLYHVNVSQTNFENHLSYARRWLHATVGVTNAGYAKPCLIIYDYLKLVDPADMKNLSEFQAIGFMATSLQNFALKYKIPILVMCQLNRDGIDKENSSVVAGSDRIIWFCSNFSILKKKSIEEVAINSEGTHKLVPMDVRHGPGVNFKEYINLDINGATFKIIDKGLSTHSQNLVQNEQHRENIIEAANKPETE